MEESLLKIYRKLTGNEKLLWLSKQYDELHKNFLQVKSQRDKFREENERLRTKMREEDLQYPSQLSGKDTVTVKTYFKLREKYDALNKSFWELSQELNKLKQEEKL